MKQSMIFNRSNLSFTINMGDLIDEDYSSYDSVLNHLTMLKSPLYNVLGNHDFTVDPRFRGRIADRMGTGSGYPSFTKEGFRFIVLNTNDISLFSREEKQGQGRGNSEYAYF
ncbi:MAG: metallophosphoesterase [Bacteroidales bacterium]